MRLFIAPAIVALAGCASSPAVHIQYQAGSVDELELTLRYEAPHQDPFTQVTRSRHSVSSAAPLVESIVLTSMCRESKGERSDLTPTARAFGGWTVSRDPTASEHGLDLPDLRQIDSALHQPVTDLHTFLVAVSHQVGVDQLREVGDSQGSGPPKHASWADGKATPLGEDCIQIVVRLAAVTATSATIVTSFEPPKTACLKALGADAEAPVDAKWPNNFQLVQRTPDGINAMWGRERFSITSELRRGDGAILKADMDNDLALQLGMGCDEGGAHCKTRLPFSIHRVLTLRRVGP